jgi:predicted nuclease of predicted toxin-antitoxin system
MSALKIVVDMNLSPEWIAYLAAAGFEAIHWSTLGDSRAEDTAIMDWARKNHCAVFTHDLDFGTVLALTNAQGPSVMQVRTQDVTPDAIGKLIVTNLRRFERELIDGALVIIEHARSRVRILPLNV